MGNYLWGEKARIQLLLAVSIVILFSLLGVREIWTHENRWSSVVLEMVLRHDYWHPYLRSGVEYYDKPLLSYWLIVITSKLFHELSTWTLRLPSACMGILAIWSTYQLGNLINRQTAFIAGWMLLTTVAFSFWARAATADIHTLALCAFTVLWYYRHRAHSSFISYFIFAALLAINGICKGVIGPALTCLAILPDLLINSEWKKHLNIHFLFGFLLGLSLYFIPFALSAHFSGEQVGMLGLKRVFYENFVRFTNPWDHKGPVYLYCLILPLYLLPWTFFFIPAFTTGYSRWNGMSLHGKRYLLATICIFIFLTLSKGRRDYYILPILPFAILVCAEWVSSKISQSITTQRITQRTMGAFIAINALIFIVLQPLYYGFGGADEFAKEVRSQAELIHPWSQWRMVMLDSRLRDSFHLQPSTSPTYCYYETNAHHLNTQELLNDCPALQAKDKQTIYVSREAYIEKMASFFPSDEYIKITMPLTLGEKLLHSNDGERSVAYIPK